MDGQPIPEIRVRKGSDAPSIGEAAELSPAPLASFEALSDLEESDGASTVHSPDPEDEDEHPDVEYVAMEEVFEDDEGPKTPTPMDFGGEEELDFTLREATAPPPPRPPSPARSRSPERPPPPSKTRSRSPSPARPARPPSPSSGRSQSPSRPERPPSPARGSPKRPPSPFAATPNLEVPIADFPGAPNKEEDETESGESAFQQEESELVAIHGDEEKAKGESAGTSSRTGSFDQLDEPGIATERPRSTTPIKPVSLDAYTKSGSEENEGEEPEKIKITLPSSDKPKSQSKEGAHAGWMDFDSGLFGESVDKGDEEKTTGASWKRKAPSPPAPPASETAPDTDAPAAAPAKTGWMTFESFDSPQEPPPVAAAGASGPPERPTAPPAKKPPPSRPPPPSQPARPPPPNLPPGGLKPPAHEGGEETEDTASNSFVEHDDSEKSSLAPEKEKKKSRGISPRRIKGYVDKKIEKAKTKKELKKKQKGEDDLERFLEIQDRVGDKKSSNFQAFEEMQQRINANMQSTQQNLSKIGESIDTTVRDLEVSSASSPWTIMGSVEEAKKKQELTKRAPASGWIGFEDSFDASKHIQATQNLPHLNVTPIPSPKHQPVPPNNSRRSSMDSEKKEEDSAVVDLLGGIGGNSADLIATAQQVTGDILGLDTSGAGDGDILGLSRNPPSGSQHSSGKSSPIPFDSDLLALAGGDAEPSKDEADKSEPMVDDFIDDFLGIKKEEPVVEVTKAEEPPKTADAFVHEPLVKDSIGKLELKPIDDDDPFGFGKQPTPVSASMPGSLIIGFLDIEEKIDDPEEDPFMVPETAKVITAGGKVTEALEKAAIEKAAKEDPFGFGEPPDTTVTSLTATVDLFAMDAPVTKSEDKPLIKAEDLFAQTSDTKGSPFTAAADLFGLDDSESAAVKPVVDLFAMDDAKSADDKSATDLFTLDDGKSADTTSATDLFSLDDAKTADAEPASDLFAVDESKPADEKPAADLFAIDEAKPADATPAADLFAMDDAEPADAKPVADLFGMDAVEPIETAPVSESENKVQDEGDGLFTKPSESTESSLAAATDLFGQDDAKPAEPVTPTKSEKKHHHHHQSKGKELFGGINISAPVESSSKGADIFGGLSIMKPPTKKEILAEMDDDFDPRCEIDIVAKPVVDAADAWESTGDSQTATDNPFSEDLFANVDANEIISNVEAKAETTNEEVFGSKAGVNKVNEVEQPVAMSSANPFATAVSATMNPFATEVTADVPFADDALDIFGVDSTTEETSTTTKSFNPFATIVDESHDTAEPTPGGGFDPFQTIQGDDAFVEIKSGADKGADPSLIVLAPPPKKPLEEEDEEGKDGEKDKEAKTEGEEEKKDEEKDDSASPPRVNPFDKVKSLDKYEEFKNAEAEIKSPGSQGSKRMSSETSFEDVEEELSPIEEFLPAFEADGWKLLLRFPVKKKLSTLGNRYWRPVYVRVQYNRDVPVIRVYNDENAKEPFHELQLQASYNMCDLGLQTFDQFGKCHTLKIQYVFYRERVGVKADRIAPTLSDLSRVRDLKGLKDLVHKPKTTMILDHAPQASELLKFGGLNYDDFRTFKYALEDAFFRLKAYRDKTLTYTKDEITMDMVDEYYADIDYLGRILSHKARVRVFCLAFLTGMPKCELGINDRKRRGKEVVGRHDIIPIKTEEWVRTEDPEFHSCVLKDEYDRSTPVKFAPLDACQFEFMRFRVRPQQNKELPLQIRSQISIVEKHVEIRADVLIPGYYSNSRRANQTPCEDIQIRFPIPQPWIYLFRVEKRFRYGSKKSSTRKTGKIVGLERLAMIAQGVLPPSLIEVSSGTAKYENIFQAVVWRIPRLPERNEGAYKTHLFKLMLDLGPHDSIPDELATHINVEFLMRNSTVSRAQIRSISVASDEPPDKWVNHLAKYQYRVEIEHVDPNAPREEPTEAGIMSPREPESPVRETEPDVLKGDSSTSSDED